jgi:hypothetical protein
MDVSWTERWENLHCLDALNVMNNFMLKDFMCNDRLVISQAEHRKKFGIPYLQELWELLKVFIFKNCKHLEAFVLRASFAKGFSLKFENLIERKAKEFIAPQFNALMKDIILVTSQLENESAYVFLALIYLRKQECLFLADALFQDINHVVPHLCGLPLWQHFLASLNCIVGQFNKASLSLIILNSGSFDSVG